MADVVITTTIPDAKVTEFRTGFLRAMPLPRGMTEKDWIAQAIKEYLIRRYKKGKHLLAQEALQYDDIFPEPELEIP